MKRIFRKLEKKEKGIQLIFENEKVSFEEFIKAIKEMPEDGDYDIHTMEVVGYDLNKRQIEFREGEYEC